MSVGCIVNKRIFITVVYFPAYVFVPLGNEHHSVRNKRAVVNGIVTVVDYAVFVDVHVPCLKRTTVVVLQVVLCGKSLAELSVLDKVSFLVGNQVTVLKRYRSKSFPFCVQIDRVAAVHKQIGNVFFACLSVEFRVEVPTLEALGLVGVKRNVRNVIRRSL